MSDDKRPAVTPETDTEQPKPAPETPEPPTDDEVSPFSTLTGPAKQVSAKQYAPHKRWRVIAAVLAAAAVLGGGLFAATRTDWLKPPEASDAASADESAEPALEPLIDKSALGTDAVERVEIGAGDEVYTLQQNADGLMTVADLAELPRNADAVESLLSALLTVTPQSQVLADATDEDLAACGLLPPAAYASVTYTDGDTFSFEIGRLESGENAHYYFRKTGDSAVYLAEAALYQLLTRPATDYLATVLAPAPAPAADDDTGTARLDRLTLTGSLRAEPVTLRRTGDADPASIRLAGNYVLESPYYRPVNTELVYPWETGLCDTTASGVAAVHPTDAQLAGFGLDEPRSVGALTFAVFPDGGEPYNRVTYTLSLGGKDEHGDYYALVDGVDAVYTVAASAVPWAEATYGDVVSSSLFLHYITEVSDITITVGDEVAAVHLTHSGGETSDAAATFTAALGDQTLSEADTRTLYRLMMMVGRVASDDAADAPTGTPALTLRLAFLDPAEADVVLSFYPHSANRYLCVAQDGDTFPVKAADVENLLTQIERYLAGETVEA